MRISILSTLFLLIFASFPAMAKADSSMASFLYLLGDEFETTSLLLEYTGPENERISPIAVTVDNHPLNWRAFQSVPEAHADDFEIKEVEAKPLVAVKAQDMQNFLRHLNTLTDQPVEKSGEGVLSLTVVSGHKSPYRSFYRTFDRHQANDLFVYIRGDFQADPKDITIIKGKINFIAMRQLQSFGCATGLIPDAAPAKDVSNQVSVTRGGLRFDMEKHRFESTVTLKNTSGHPIRGPISLVVDMSSSGGHVANAHGNTCITKPVGRAFITFPMPRETLNAGQALEMTLLFSGIEDEDTDFTTKVLAGAGER